MFILKNIRKAIAVVALVLCAAGHLEAQPRVEKNVVYGMYSGLALLMDVHYPAVSKGRAVIFVAGSAFSRPLGQDAPQLKDAPIVRDFVKRLNAAGYTVFALNHRAAPRFQYPAPVEDAQRAVRFIRANATTFHIDPNKIGAAGASSGGNLVSMLGTLDGSGGADDTDPVNRLSAKVQAVVALFAPFDLAAQVRISDLRGLPEAMYVGAAIGANTSPGEREYKQYTLASPISYVTRDDSPFLLIHGEQDTVVPIEQSVTMEAALKKAGVEVKFVRVPGGKHGRNFGFAADDPRLPSYLDTVAQWFDANLK